MQRQELRARPARMPTPRALTQLQRAARARIVPQLGTAPRQITRNQLRQVRAKRRAKLRRNPVARRRASRKYCPGNGLDISLPCGGSFQLRKQLKISHKQRRKAAATRVATEVRARKVAPLVL